MGTSRGSQGHVSPKTIRLVIVKTVNHAAVVARVYLLLFRAPVARDCERRTSLKAPFALHDFCLQSGRNHRERARHSTPAGQAPLASAQIIRRPVAGRIARR